MNLNLIIIERTSNCFFSKLTMKNMIKKRQVNSSRDAANHGLVS